MLRSRKIEAIKKGIIKKRIKLFILMYLVFITAYLSVNTLSKYTGVSSGSGNVQVAKWEVFAEPGSNSTMNVVSGEGNATSSYIVKVKSTSDVGCTYSIVVSNLPSGIKIKLDQGEFQPTAETITFDNCGRFDAGSQGTWTEHTLTIAADISTGEIQNQTIDVDVIFVQDVID